MKRVEVETGGHPGLTRRSFMTGLALLGCAFPVASFAQRAQPARMRRIGLVIGDDPEGLEAASRYYLTLNNTTARNLGLTFLPRCCRKPTVSCLEHSGRSRHATA
jgi:hypothetical protein